MKRVKEFLPILLLPLLLLVAVDAAAQTETPVATPESEPSPAETPAAVPATHLVLEGENLTSIAAQYDVSVADLLLVNGLDDDAVIYPGQELVIPGGEGAVVAATYTVQLGDTLAGVARQFGTTTAAVAGPNHLVADTLFAGQTLSLVSQNGTATARALTGTLHLVEPGETLLSLAARYRLPPETIVEANNLEPAARLFPGLRLRVPGTGRYASLPGGWREVAARPVPATQGDTVSIYATHQQGGPPAGTFAGQPLHFSPYQDGYVALVGLDAFTEPGQYLLELTGREQAEWWPFRQEIQVVSGNYPTQTINVPAALAPLLAPEVRAEEDAVLSTIYGQFTPEQHWSGLFQMPVSNTIVTAGYGGARSYNGGPFEIFHTGVDLGGTTGTPIMAPAAGTIVFSDTLELRGQTVIIDHGLGVYSGYYHLSQIMVGVGEQVLPGETIGLGGSSGLSTGPHLHWELRVMDVPVDGRQWTETAFP